MKQLRKKVRTWAEHEALLEASAKAMVLQRRSGYRLSRAQAEAICDGKALAKLQAVQ